MIRIGGLEIFILIIIALLILWASRNSLGKVSNFLAEFFKNGDWVSNLLAIIGLVGGYSLGSKILPLLVYTSWERHVVATNSSGYTSGLRGDYAATALLGGIVGAILFTALAIVISRSLKKK